MKGTGSGSFSQRSSTAPFVDPLSTEDGGAKERETECSRGPLTAKLCVEVLFQFVHLLFAFLLLGFERVDLCPDLFERGLQVLECF